MKFKINIKKIFQLLLLFTIISIVVNIPTFYGYFHKIPNKVFTGNSSVFDPWDINVYVSVINWGQKYGFSFQNAYTTEAADNKVIFYPFYTVMGVIFQKTDPYLLYNLATFLMNIVCLATIFVCANIFLKNEHHAKIVTLLIPFTAGLGWAIGNISMPDLSLTHFTFTGTFEMPHALFAISFYLISLTLFYYSVMKEDYRYALLSSLMGIVFTLIYPYLLLSYFLTCILFVSVIFMKTKKVRILITLISLIIPGLVGILFSIHLLNSKGFDNVINIVYLKPVILNVILSYGIVLFSFIFYKPRKNKTAFIFLRIWFIVGILLAYSPFGFSRYFFRSLFFPLLVIFIDAFYYARNKFSSVPLKNLVTYFAFIILTSGGILLLLLKFNSIEKGLTWHYINENEYKLINYLKYTANEKAGVIAPPPLSNFIPAKTLNKVYYGHGAQTPNGKEKLNIQNRFYNNDMTENEAEDLIVANNITYVVWGSENSDDKPSNRYTFLKPEARFGNLTLYLYRK